MLLISKDLGTPYIFLHAARHFQMMSCWAGKSAVSSCILAVHIMLVLFLYFDSQNIANYILFCFNLKNDLSSRSLHKIIFFCFLFYLNLCMLLILSSSTFRYLMILMKSPSKTINNFLCLFLWLLVEIFLPTLFLGFSLVALAFDGITQYSCRYKRTMLFLFIWYSARLPNFIPLLSRLALMIVTLLNSNKNMKLF